MRGVAVLRQSPLVDVDQPRGVEMSWNDRLLRVAIALIVVVALIDWLVVR